MENKVFCKMRINEPRKICYIVSVLLAIVSFIVIILSMIPVREKAYFSEYYGAGVTYYNVFGEWFKEENSRGYTNWCGGSFWGFLFFNFIPCVPCILLILVLLFVTWYALSRFMCQKCTLELNQDGVYGKKKTLFSLKSINQPFEKIDNVSIRDSIIDKLLGGQTLVIRSSSSCIKFSCVDNAQEFLDKTLEELKEYKEAVNSKSEKATPTSSDGDAMEAIVKLKNLLDQGLITQEEFDCKRKSLIDKI